jgi:hypothetical protein
MNMNMNCMSIMKMNYRCLNIMNNMNIMNYSKNHELRRKKNHELHDHHE